MPGEMLTEAEIEALRTQRKKTSEYARWVYARVEIAPGQLDAWQTSIHLVTAARACRHVASILDEPLKTEAVALAEELEQRVGERPDTKG
jgi:hypothetical protein